MTEIYEYIGLQEQWGYMPRTYTKNDKSYHGCDLDDGEHKLGFSIASDAE